MSLLRTPLYDLCVKDKARMTSFAGWEMPVQFSGIKQEHAAVRTAVGMFDISHMGKFILTGDDVLRSLQQLVPSDLGRLAPGKAQYTVLLNPQGGIIDDLIIYDEGKQVTLIVNASTTEKDKQIILGILTQGQLFGEMALIDDAPRTATATALKDTVLTVVSREQLMERLNNAEPMLRMLVRVIIARYRTGISQTRSAGMNSLRIT